MAGSETVLVTGGSGFVGMHILLQLLQRGFEVRTTLRSLKNRDRVIETLRAHGVVDMHKLSFVEAELTADEHWEEAMTGCRYVLSVASPVFLSGAQDEQEAMRPAIEGILRILKFAKKAKVKRVVMTSSFGALGFSHTDKKTETTEEDWTDPDLKGLSVYEKSKGLSERAAWDFIKREGGALELTTINPVAILGPSLNGHVSESFGLLKHLLDGSMKIIPNIPLNIVDVRDVADLHIRAMTDEQAKGQRFIATADGQMSMPEIALLLKQRFPDHSSKVSTRTLPDWVLKLASLFNEQAKGGVMFLKVNRNVSNAKARNLLGWKQIATMEEAIMVSVESMLQYDLIK